MNKDIVIDIDKLDNEKVVLKKGNWHIYLDKEKLTDLMQSEIEKIYGIEH